MEELAREYALRMDDPLGFEGFAHGFEARDKIAQEREKKLVEALNTAKRDYWFMINLLENYSSDKDQAIKDCIERMKFRKPIFNVLDDYKNKPKEN